MGIEQIIISGLFSLTSSFLTYLLSIKKLDAEIEKNKINSKNEINKIKEETKKEIEKIKAESLKEIDKIKTEHEEYRKNNKFDSKLNRIETEEKMKNKFAVKFLNDFIENPDDGFKKIDSLLKLQQKIPKH